YSTVVVATRDLTPNLTAAGRRVGSGLTFWTDEPVLSRAVAGALLALFVFVFADLAFYGYHRLMHRVPFLWAFHKVHHTATELYPLTAYRGHPGQVVVGSIAVGVTSSFAGGLFLE